MRKVKLEERRKATRIEVDVLVNYTKTVKASTKDINENGIRIKTDESFRIREYLTLTFSLPEKPEIRAYAKVIWCHKMDSGLYETGLEFWDIRKADRDILQKYVEDSCSKGKNG